jgi:pimeloyl-ACP methyl ester carboxylesterase
MSLKNYLLPREGVSIYYEVRGTGPLLFLISAAYGTSEPYEPLARSLAERFTVVAFDRRGYFRSKKLDWEATWPSDTFINENVHDTAALIKHLSKEPVPIFASCSGSAVAVELLRLYPALVQQLILHEVVPCIFPGATFLDLMPSFRVCGDDYKESGTMAATQTFLPLMMSERDRDMIRDSQGYQQLLALTTVAFDTLFKYELDALLDYHLPLDVMERHRGIITLLYGATSETRAAVEPIRNLSTILRLPLNEVPGSHAGYVTDPEEFAQKLGDIVERQSAGSGTKGQIVKSRL